MHPAHRGPGRAACPWSADPLGTAFVAALVARGGGNPVNMWGPPGGPGRQAHDTFARAGALAGTALFLSAASGIPGELDRGGLPGPPVEALARSCTAAFAARLDRLGIPATYLERPRGSHTWGQFEADLHESWPLLARALGA